MNFEYYYRKLFSADHRESLVFSHIRDQETALKYWKNMGAKFVVQSHFLATNLDIETTDHPERTLKKALASGELVFGIKAVSRIGFPFYFSEDLDEPDDILGCKGLNFVVINKKKFLKAFPGCDYCQDVVFNKLREKEDYFQRSLNESLTEVLFRGEGLKTEVIGIFANDDQAYEVARKEFPYIKYREEDFVVERWALKPGLA